MDFAGRFRLTRDRFDRARADAPDPDPSADQRETAPDTEKARKIETGVFRSGDGGGRGFRSDGSVLRQNGERSAEESENERAKEDWAEVKDNPDIVAIKQHFAVDYLQDRNEDRIRQLSQINPLKNAEMSMEDDYGMIDGIINNGKAPVKEESKEKKPSVIEQLKNQPQQSRKKSTPKKTKEKEL